MIIEHVAMYVNDLEKARDFFVSLFEMKQQKKKEKHNGH